MRPHPVLAAIAGFFLLGSLAWHFGELKPWVYTAWQWSSYRIGLPANDLDLASYVQGIERYPGVFEKSASRPIFLNRPVTQRPLSYILPKGMPQVLAASSEDDKWIEIDISQQHLYAHEGDQVVFDFPISSGKFASTPLGEYRVWIKLRYHRMIGGSKELGTYYDLPNVPFVMYFYKGYGLHGAYWHNNFGQPMSHGCVNISIPDAEKLFEWAGPTMPEGASVVKPTADNPGTRVVIHE